MSNLGRDPERESRVRRETPEPDMRDVQFLRTMYTGVTVRYGYNEWVVVRTIGMDGVEE